MVGLQVLTKGKGLGQLGPTLNLALGWV